MNDPNNTNMPGFIQNRIFTTKFHMCEEADSRHQQHYVDRKSQMSNLKFICVLCRLKIISYLAEVPQTRVGDILYEIKKILVEQFQVIDHNYIAKRLYISFQLSD